MQVAIDSHAAIVAFANFGEAPTSLWGAPAYALRVRARKRILLRDLAVARQHRSHDVGLYEASLRTADDVAVRNGIIAMFALAMAATFILLALVYAILW